MACPCVVGDTALRVSAHATPRDPSTPVVPGRRKPAVLAGRPPGGLQPIAQALHPELSIPVSKTCFRPAPDARKNAPSITENYFRVLSLICPGHQSR